MLVTNAKLSNVRMVGNSLIATSAESKGLLKQDELIILVEGIQTELSLISKEFPKAQKGRSSDSRGRDEFNYFETYAEAMETFQKHPSKIVKFDPAELEVIDFHEQGNELQYDVIGDFIDMGRVLEGIPEAFGSLHSGKARNRRVRVVVNVSQVDTMGQNEINQRSERIIRLINALELHNFPVELTAVDSCTCYHVENIVKRFNEPLILEDVAIVTHSEYLRRIHFRVSEYSDTWYGGYGSPSVLERNIDGFKSEYNDELTIFIGNDMRSSVIDGVFNRLDEIVTEELSSPIPKICLIKAERHGVSVVDF